jgi:phospholipase/carboxylesterase
MNSNADLVVVLLHGWNMCADDFLPFTHSIGVPATYLVPQATISVTERGYGWWPVDTQMRDAALRVGARDLFEQVPVGRVEARQVLAARVNATLQANPAARLVLGGFSQGGMLACEALLHQDFRAHGLALFSSSCVALSEWRALAPRLAGLPVLMTHGSHDRDISVAAGERLRDFLLEGGAQVSWHVFEGGHEMPLSAWRRFRQLLKQVRAA